MNMNDNLTAGGDDRSPVSPLEESSFRNRFTPTAGQPTTDGDSRAPEMADREETNSVTARASATDSPLYLPANQSAIESQHKDARDTAQASPSTAMPSSRWPWLAAIAHGSSASSISSKPSDDNEDASMQEPPEEVQNSEKAVQQPRLTFYQKYFTKPVIVAPESEQPSTIRRFSFLSLGFLAIMLVLALILAATIASAVTVTLQNERKDHRLERLNHSPIRLAILDNFPDPSITYHNGTWYAFATNNAAGILEQPSNFSHWEHGLSNVQLATSDNFSNWTQWNFTNDPLPRVGAWARQGPRGDVKGFAAIPDANVWAPATIQNDRGDWLMYYSAAITVETSDLLIKQHPYPERINPKFHPLPHCVGASVSESGTPFGPFRPVNATFACQLNQGGVIDPAAIRDADGTLWVTYKIDGNSMGFGGECNNGKAPIQPTPIMLQKMFSDGITPDGDPIEILDRDVSDGPLIEAPELVRTHEGKYFLFFSSGCTRNNDYNVKYATADNITGPYVRAQNRLLQTGDWGLLAPGSVGIHDDMNGGFNMVFHARVSTGFGRVRAMFSTKLQFKGHKVTMVSDHSDGKQHRH